MDSPTMAWFRRKLLPRLTHYPDWGSQYTNHVFQVKLSEYGSVCSTSRKGSCRDNVLTEGFVISFQSEWAYGTRHATRAESVSDLFDDIEVFCNRNRCNSARAYRSPVEFLHDRVTNQHERKIAA